MIDLRTWIGVFLDRLTECFGERIWFVGLQGSYGRGEATETSDLDMVVILDDLLPSDISKERRHMVLLWYKRCCRQRYLLDRQ